MLFIRRLFRNPLRVIDECEPVTAVLYGMALGLIAFAVLILIGSVT